MRQRILSLLSVFTFLALAITPASAAGEAAKILKIGANLLVERDSQKRIVVGRGGSMVKKIGIRARQSIEEWVGCKVHLELFVKVDPSWLKNGRRIQELGYL